MKSVLFISMFLALAASPVLAAPPCEIEVVLCNYYSIGAATDTTLNELSDWSMKMPHRTEQMLDGTASAEFVLLGKNDKNVCYAYSTLPVGVCSCPDSNITITPVSGESQDVVTGNMQITYKIEHPMRRSVIQ
jgi:hypothetical protein